MDREKGMAYCGLACCVCSENTDCAGCRMEGCRDKEWCKSFNCCKDKHYSSCADCREYPCDYDMLHKVRSKVFLSLIRSIGEERLLTALENGEKLGLRYHFPGQLIGDYDRIKTEQELKGIMRELCEGRLNIITFTPKYETESLVLREVRMEDAEDLLSCYSDEKAWPLFNKDNCTSDFQFTSISQIQETIGYWNYDAQASNYIRMSIIDKAVMKTVGTIELFNWGDKKLIKNLGLLRIDLASGYEKTPYINEVIRLVEDRMCPALGIEYLSTKAVCLAEERLKILKAAKYKLNKDIELYNFDDYYIKKLC